VFFWAEERAEIQSEWSTRKHERVVGTSLQPGAPFLASFARSGDLGQRVAHPFAPFAKGWDSSWLRASSDLLSCAGSQNPKKFAVQIPTLAKHARIGIRSKATNKSVRPTREKSKSPSLSLATNGRDKDGAPDKTNH
jgi:hypothetical protein